MNWKEIFKHLKESGFDVYSLGQHQGKCSEPYLVLRNNGAGIDLSMVDQEYEVLIYYPSDRYSQFEDYIEMVKQSMNSLFPAVKLVDDQQPHYPDDDVKAFMTSLIYRAPRRNTINTV